MSQTHSIPLIGLGTWDLRGDACVRAVCDAIEIGYRHVDTAQMYENEREVGRGLTDSGVDRHEIFLTTKLWLDNLSRDRVASSVDESLSRLGTEYVDLLLIHWPSADVPLEQTLAAMQAVHDAGRTRAIGVSNFPTALWTRALDIANVTVNQVECHPFLTQPALTDFARERRLTLVAYTPIAKGRVASNPIIQAIAKRHGRSEVQVSLRWLTQRNIVAIPKSSRRERIASNLRALEFDLSQDEVERISSLDRGLRLVDPGWAPAWD